MKSTGFSLGMLCAKLRERADKGHIFHLNDVWDFYCNLRTEAQEVVPNSFISHRSTFKVRLEELMYNIYDFHVLENGVEQENGTVLVPTDKLVNIAKHTISLQLLNNFELSLHILMEPCNS